MWRLLAILVVGAKERLQSSEAACIVVRIALLLVAAATIWLGGNDAREMQWLRGEQLATGVRVLRSVSPEEPQVDAPLARPPQADKLGFAEMVYLVAVQESVTEQARMAESQVATRGAAIQRADIGDLLALEGVICAPQYSWDCGWAVATVMCESNGSPNAHGHEWYQDQLLHFFGWWQVVAPHENDWLFDPVLNTIEAHIKFMERGAAPWPYCGYLVQ